MYSQFNWPTPASYELAATADHVGPEPALVVLARGQKLQGALIRFLPTHAVVEFLPSRGRINLDLPFVDVIELRLTRPVMFRRRRTELDARADGLVRPGDKQPFRVELANGEVQSGETLGFELQAAGLFLYMVQYGESAVIRSFIPAASLKSQQIGRPLGEILVDEQLVTDTQVRSALTRQQALREQKLGDLLAEQRAISRDQLHAALERQRAMPMVKLGEALVESKIITRQQLEQALQRQKENRKRPLGELLVELGHLTQDDLYRALSQKLGIPSVDLKSFRIDPAALKALPESLIHEFSLLPLCHDGATLVVATANPLDPAPAERIRFVTQQPVTLVIANPADIQDTIRREFGARTQERKIEDLATQLGAEAATVQQTDEAVKETDSTLVRLVNRMIIDAHAAGASDIHVETNAGRRNVAIRFRRDGVMHTYLQLASGFGQAMLSRLKIMANLDIAERRRAQDGRINFQQYGGLKLELRVATVPTLEGLEDAVLRLLASGEPLPLAKLGLRAPLLAAVEELLGRSHGLVLVCGPTGSGKTTTLHSLLGVINSPERKIWTAEDPVEISQEGLRQVQVNSRIGWTFAAAMRAFLRGDPDVIMVGEMRDTETAAVAIEASLTGHLVLSTLHTNSAPETVIRLLEMGMDPFSFADSLAGVLAQRLARRLCAACRQERVVAPDDLDELANEYVYDSPFEVAGVKAPWMARGGGAPTLYHAPGCQECRGTGYRGRIGLHELLMATPDLRQQVQRRARASELRTAALQAGMRTLKQDGIEKALVGLTDLQEVRAVAS